MSKKKSKRSPVRGRKRSRADRAATPAETLEAVVFTIAQQAKTRSSADSLIAGTPNETIRTCWKVLNSLAFFSTNKSEDLVMVHPKVLHTIVSALAHAEGETKTLWDAARKMFDVRELGEVANG